jgi:hypothetical protein
MMNDDDERSWALYYGMGMELWLSREYFFWRIMRVDVLVTIKNCPQSQHCYWLRARACRQQSNKARTGIQLLKALSNRFSGLADIS